jgi:hypothetical protein
MPHIREVMWAQHLKCSGEVDMNEFRTCERGEGMSQKCQKQNSVPCTSHLKATAGTTHEEACTPRELRSASGFPRATKGSKRSAFSVDEAGR